MDTTIIIPVYNESGRLHPEKFVDFCGQVDHVQFLFVDDGSTDDSTATIQNLIHRCPGRFSLLRLSRNMGKAEAIRNGMLKMFLRPPDYIGYWDADLSTPLNEIPRFLDVLYKNPAVHLVTGARLRLLGRVVERSNLKHYMGRVSATLISEVLGIPCYDTQCGAKIFRLTNTIQSLFVDPFVSQWIFDVEILARLLECAKKDSDYHPCQCVYELPLRQWIDRPGSKVRARDYLLALWDLMKIRAM